MIVALWSGPRNVSTALMYSFRSHADFSVVDEPLYAHYLHRTGVAHPGRDEVLRAQSVDHVEVIAQTFLGEYPTPNVFLKNMAHHLEGIDIDVIDQFTNVILTRDPTEMLPSLVHQVPNPDLLGTSLPIQVEILEREIAAGRDPLVLESRYLLNDPEAVLSELCSRIGVDFDRAMLHWESGPKAEDGIWAPYWYDSVHRTTGFTPYRPKDEPMPLHLRALHSDAMPLYETLRDHAITGEAS